jgi:hypothetical protein
VAGEAGVRHAVEILAAVSRGMAQLGANSLDEL